MKRRRVSHGERLCPSIAWLFTEGVVIGFWFLPTRSLVLWLCGGSDPWKKGFGWASKAHFQKGCLFKQGDPRRPPRRHPGRRKIDKSPWVRISLLNYYSILWPINRFPKTRGSSDPGRSLFEETREGPTTPKTLLGTFRRPQSFSLFFADRIRSLS